jgi:RNA polymerase sigma factor (sigma-70 family)
MDAEEDLVRRSRAGDHLAFARLIELHQTIAYRVATAIAGSGSEADDIVQDAFIKSYLKLDQFDEGRSFRAWLLAIVANEARNRRRSAGRRAAVTLRIALSADAQAVDVAADPSRAYEADELRRRLAAAVGRLPRRDREIVALRYFAELSEAETAQALRCPVGTVKSRLSRALRRLRTEMVESELADEPDEPREEVVP